MPIAVNGEMTTIGWLVLIATSSVLSAIVTIGLNTFLDWRKSGQSQKFAGLYVAITFERFADACATHVGESETHRDSGGSWGKAWTNLPSFPDWESEIDWKELGISHTEHSLTLLSEIGTARAELADLWDYDDEETFRMMREMSVAKGLEALQWAADLRRSLSLQKRKIGEHDVGKWLKEREADYAERRVGREARRKKSDADL